MYKEKSDGKGCRWRKRKMEPEEGWMNGGKGEKNEEGAVVDKLKQQIKKKKKEMPANVNWFFSQQV